MISIVELFDLTKSKFLRCSALYVDFWKNSNGLIFQNVSNTIALKECVSFASCKIIKKDEAYNTYLLIDLANIEPRTGYLKGLNGNIVDEIGSDKIYLSDADIVFSRLNSHIGYVFLTNEILDNEYEIIGSTEFFPLIVNKEKIHQKILKYFLLHRFFRETAMFLRTGKSQSHPRIQPDDFLNLKIPVLSPTQTDFLLQKIEEVETEINHRRKLVETLQDIINDVFIKYGLKYNKYTKNTFKSVTPTLEDISKNSALRIGAEYNAFWLNKKGYLFEMEDNRFTILPLNRIIKPSLRQVVKKGLLDEPRKLIEFEHVESPNGRIIDYENEVIEIGSDKINFGECDLLTNKLRPYLGYTILNEKDLDLIGTTEFMPFTITDKLLANTEYIRYLLLSEEYLEQSKFLMSGKEHPRINMSDILNIKVPLPSLATQEHIVKEISLREEKSRKIIEEMFSLRESIDDFVLKTVESRIVSSS